MDLLSLINDRARSNQEKKNLKIGIGLGDHHERLDECVINAKKENFAEVIIFNSAETLLTALSRNEIDGAVRGTLSANDVITNLKSVFGIDHLLRMACLKLPLSDKYIFIAPVGIDEGESVEQKLELIKLGYRFIQKLGISPSVAILTSGRLEDKDRSQRISSGFKAADEIVDLARDQNIEVNNYGILLEDAVDKCNFIIMPDGVTGNLVFRSLYFLGGAAAIGAPVLNLEKIFIDTSRAKKNYLESVAFAAALVE
jgi:putative methanogen marker protein 4